MKKILCYVVFFFLIGCIFHCKDKNKSNVQVTPQAISESGGMKNDLENHDHLSGSEPKTYTAPRDKPMVKDPKCVSSPEAGLYTIDVAISPTEPVRLVSKLSRFPWVEIVEDSGTVRYKDSCNTGGQCYYKEMYMHPEDLADCNEVSASILKKVKDKKPLSEILMGLKIYGSTMKNDGTSGIYEAPIAEEEVGNMDASSQTWSFQWKTKGTSLVLKRVYGETDSVSSDDENFHHECNEKDRFKTMHAGGYIDGYGCAYSINGKVDCEITGVSISSDNKFLKLQTKYLGSEPKLDPKICDAAISLEGYDPFPVQTIME